MDDEAQAAPHERRRCSGTSKQTGQPCGQAPVPGATVCRFHGGAAPQVVAAAERRQQEEQGRALVAKYGLPVRTTWQDALQGSLDEAYGNLLFLREQVQKLAPEALTWGVSQEVTVGSSQFPGVDVTRLAGPVPEVLWYERALDRVQKFALDAGKLGLQAEQQRISQDIANQVTAVIRGTLLELAQLIAAGELATVDPGHPTVLRVVSTQLRALGTEPA